jgi:hypothetical protein
VYRLLVFRRSWCLIWRVQSFEDRHTNKLRNVGSHVSNNQKTRVLSSTADRTCNLAPHISLLISFNTECVVSLPVPEWGPDSSVGIAACYGLEGPGIESRWGARFSAPVPTGPGAHPASCTMGTGFFPGVKRPGRGVDHPPHLAPRLKKEYS